MDNSSSFDNTINSIRFNGDHSCVALATNRGFKVYSLEPFELKQSRDFGAPLQMVEMINRSNLLGLVGYKETPFAPGDKLAIFDDNAQKIIADISFRSMIKSVCIRQNKIVVALYNKVFILDLFSMQIEHVIETFKFEETEKYNIVTLSNNPDNLILAAPAVESGHVLLVFFNRLTERKVKAHQSILSAVELSQGGEKLATTSEKGIQIRIFNTKSGDMLQEVRRGNQFATIYSLVFSKNARWLAVSSDSFNLHVFSCESTEAEKAAKYENQVEKNEAKNPKSMLYFMRSVFPYFDAEYSFATYKIDDFETEMQSVLAFSQTNDNIFLVSNKATFERIQLNKKGGKCRLIEKKTQI